MAEHNKVQVTWLPDHEGIDSSETAEHLAKLRSEHLFIGPEQACGISMGVAKKVVRDWTIRGHRKHLD
jgi:hypothetical protein